METRCFTDDGPCVPLKALAMTIVVHVQADFDMRSRMVTCALASQSLRQALRLTVAFVLVWLLFGCGASAEMPPPSVLPGGYESSVPPERAVAMTGAAAGPMADEEGAPGVAPVPQPAPVAAPGLPAGQPTKPGDMGAGKGPRTASAAQAKELDPEAAKAPAPDTMQMLIYEAQLHVEVAKDVFAKSIDRVVDVAVSLGGYVASHDNQQVQVRVPSARFRDALKEIEKLGEVATRTVQVQDVSEEYNDLAVRLKSLRATRDRLEQFLARAKDIQEVLAVERELSRLNGEIDRIEGRMRFLASRAAFSTITVVFQPKAEHQVVVDPTDQPPPPPQTIVLPIEWLRKVGLDRLLDLR